MADAPLFCPFCGECFEGETECPEHEIPLVRFEELDRLRGHPLPADDEEVAPYDLRFSRGWVFGGAAAMLAGFFMPFLATDFGNDDIRVASGFDAASTVAMNLWVLPLVAMTLVSIVGRRRTPASMRGVRVAVPMLALMAASSLGYTLWRVTEGAERLLRAYGQGVEISVGFGVYVACGGVLLALVGGLRLGAMPKAKPPQYRVE